MSRVEKSEEPQSPSPYIKDEVVEELYDKKKKSNGRFSCLGIFLIGFILLIGFGAWQIAATGLVHIPLLSSFSFSNPKPIRVVEAGTSVEQLSETYFKTTLIKRLQAGGGTLKDRTVTLELPESALTATVQNELKKTTLTEIDAGHAQIAVLGGQELELFLPINMGNQKTALIVRIALVANNGMFDLKLLNVRLGSLHLPSALIGSWIQPFVNRELGSLNQALSSYMQVDSITTQGTSLNVSGTFTVQIKK